MNQLRWLGRKYEELAKKVLELDALVNPTQADEAEKQRLIEESNNIMRSIMELRHCSNDIVSYTVRSDFRGAQRSNIEKLRKQAAVYRFCMDQAKKAEKRGDHNKATNLRNKARVWVEDMSILRRLSIRTLDTPVGDGSLQIKRPTAPVKR